MTIEIGHKGLAADVVRTLVKVASTILQNSNDTERSSYSADYTKRKEIKLNGSYSGTMRIDFDAKGNGANMAYARIYKNGIAIGTEHSFYLGDWVTYSETFTISLVTNDLLQIYTRNSVWLQNMRFYYSNKMTAIGEDIIETEILVTCSAISTTNQDP